MSPKKKQEKDQTRLCVLVVEDNDLLRELFHLALCEQHTVYLAPRVKEGWRLYKEKKPDITFVDIRLPDGNGHDLTCKIKEEDSNAYVIMATVNDFIEEKEKAAHNHADGFIAKPFDRQEINDCLERYLALKNRD